MATAVRRQLSALIRDLETAAAGFDFFQAVRLLEAATPGQPSEAARPNAALRLRPAPEVSFPAADLRRASREETGALALELNFLGLYGVDAPLPSYFWEAVARRDEGGERLRAFLDLFSHRLYELLYLAWKKTRAHQFERGEDSVLECYLQALAGSPAAARPDLTMAFAGKLGGRVKSAAGLAGILAEQFAVRARVDQFVPCWVAIGGAISLGSPGLALGDNLVVGERVLDVGRKVNIVFGPMAMDDALALFPGRGRSGDLIALVRSYLDPTLEFDFVFRVAGNQRESARLGEDPIHLGWTTTLGAAPVGIREIRLAGSAYQHTGATNDTN